MKINNLRNIFYVVGFLLLVFIPVYALTNGCGDEMDTGTSCVIRTPPINCNTYSIYNSSNNLIFDGVSMEEVLIGTGVYNFTFSPNGTGVHSIILCDNTSGIINVKTQTEISQENISEILEIVQYIERLI